GRPTKPFPSWSGDVRFTQKRIGGRQQFVFTRVEQAVPDNRTGDIRGYSPQSDNALAKGPVHLPADDGPWESLVKRTSALIDERALRIKHEHSRRIGSHEHEEAVPSQQVTPSDLSGTLAPPTPPGADAAGAVNDDDEVSLYSGQDISEVSGAGDRDSDRVQVGQVGLLDREGYLGDARERRRSRGRWRLSLVVRAIAGGSQQHEQCNPQANAGSGRVQHRHSGLALSGGVGRGQYVPAPGPAPGVVDSIIIEPRNQM